MQNDELRMLLLLWDRGLLKDTRKLRRVLLRGEYGLSLEELDLLAYLPTSLSYEAIAEEVGRPTDTVLSQKRALFNKLGVTTRSEAAALAARFDLLPNDQHPGTSE